MLDIFVFESTFCSLFDFKFYHLVGKIMNIILFVFQFVVDCCADQYKEMERSKTTSYPYAFVVPYENIVKMRIAYHKFSKQVFKFTKDVWLSNVSIILPFAAPFLSSTTFFTWSYRKQYVVLSTSIRSILAGAPAYSRTQKFPLDFQIVHFPLYRLTTFDLDTKVTGIFASTAR